MRFCQKGRLGKKTFVALESSLAIKKGKALYSGKALKAPDGLGLSRLRLRVFDPRRN